MSIRPSAHDHRSARLRERHARHGRRCPARLAGSTDGNPALVPAEHRPRTP